MAKRLPLDRFAEKVMVLADGCMIWNASTNSAGYGTFYTGEKVTLAHRWSFEYHVGPIPPTLQIDHLCRFRACVNPDHMELVTARTNLRRANGMSTRNAMKTHCPAGHPYSGENLYITPKSGDRKCRSCIATANAARTKRV